MYNARQDIDFILQKKKSSGEVVSIVHLIIIAVVQQTKYLKYIVKTLFYF